MRSRVSTFLVTLTMISYIPTRLRPAEQKQPWEFNEILYTTFRYSRKTVIPSAPLILAQSSSKDGMYSGANTESKNNCIPKPHRHLCSWLSRGIAVSCFLAPTDVQSTATLLGAPALALQGHSRKFANERDCVTNELNSFKPMLGFTVFQV